MPINKDKAHVSLKFAFESSDSKSQYFIHYQHIDDAPIVSVSKNGTDWEDYPAELFAEVTDFLRDQGVVEGGVSSVPIRVVDTSGRVQQAGQVTVPTSTIEDVPVAPGLPIPEIVRGDSPSISNNAMHSQEVADIIPLVSFAGVGAELLEKNTSTKKKRKKKELSDEELAEMKKRGVVRGSGTDRADVRKGSEGASFKRDD